MIQIHDKNFVPFITADDIQSVIKRMAAEVAADMGSDAPVFVGVLNGSFMVVSDFVKQYTKPCEVNFVKMASYEGTATTHNVKQLIGLGQSVKGRRVVVIEDIVDTGNTIEELKGLFEKEGVQELKIATLFFKPEAYKKNIKLDYIGMEIPDKFIVGFGLDYNGLGRNLPEIYQLK